MKKERSYSIGEVSKLCGLSKSALRHYEKIGIIKPDMFCGTAHRYYSHDLLLSLSVIKKYEQIGFKLSEIKEFTESGDYRAIKEAFKSKIAELSEGEEQVFRSYTSVKDWHELMVEAESVLHYNVTDVSVKFVEEGAYCFHIQPFSYNYRESIVNEDFTTYIESINNQITGPVIMKFPCYEEKMEGVSRTVTVLQQAIKELQEGQQTWFGGKVMVSAYHIGSHETIDETYNRICEWVNHRGYSLEPEVYERYVVDYWSTQDSSKFVTEVLMEMKRAD